MLALIKEFPSYYSLRKSATNNLQGYRLTNATAGPRFNWIACLRNVQYVKLAHAREDFNVTITVGWGLYAAPGRLIPVRVLFPAREYFCSLLDIGLPLTDLGLNRAVR